MTDTRKRLTPEREQEIRTLSKSVDLFETGTIEVELLDEIHALRGELRKVREAAQEEMAYLNQRWRDALNEIEALQEQLLDVSP